MIANFSNNKVLLFVLRRTMNKLVATLCLMGVLVGSIHGKSSKKGLCIPPGTNFHCGDLAAFDNVRYLFSIYEGVFLLIHKLTFYTKELGLYKAFRT